MATFPTIFNGGEKKPRRAETRSLLFLNIDTGFVFVDCPENKQKNTCDLISKKHDIFGNHF